MGIKKKIFSYILPFMRCVGSFFFERQYLYGKYFDYNLIEWKWLFRSIFWQKILGFNRHIPWPVSPLIRISDPKNIKFNVNDINNFQMFGNYFQNFGAKIYIGKGTYIAPNVGIITVNHNLYDLDNYSEGKEVILGEKCWIGMNSIILPGVKLGDHTIVGAGSVVKKSFPNGYVVIAGNPAKLIKNILKY